LPLDEKQQLGPPPQFRNPSLAASLSMVALNRFSRAIGQSQVSWMR